MFTITLMLDNCFIASLARGAMFDRNIKTFCCYRI